MCKPQLSRPNLDIDKSLHKHGLPPSQSFIKAKFIPLQCKRHISNLCALRHSHEILLAILSCVKRISYPTHSLTDLGAFLRHCFILPAQNSPYLQPPPPFGCLPALRCHHFSCKFSVYQRLHKHEQLSAFSLK